MRGALLANFMPFIIMLCFLNGLTAVLDVVVLCLKDRCAGFETWLRVGLAMCWKQTNTVVCLNVGWAIR